MKKISFFAAAAIAMLASCSQNDLEAPVVAQSQQGDAIEFGTYLGKAATSRAGYGGNMNTAKLKAEGFGIFAYYTGTDTYGQHQSSIYTAETAGTSVTTKYPNFMYNQKVDDTDDDGTWTYTPLKYWPNGNTAADNQSATGEGGGNVSFFAYAPYVQTATGNTGITEFTAANAAGDPKVTYTYKNSTEISTVDLLWGTLSSADNTVNNATQAGVTGENTAGDNTYKKAILNGKTVAADLTKQKINGKVNFAFIHALAGIGGGKGVSSGAGFQVKLDIDDAGTAITGGTREKFDYSGTGDAWRTIVTIKDITITNDLTDNGTIDGEDVGFYTSGKLNLATGVWEDKTGSEVLKHEIKDYAASYTYPVSKLNTKIAEAYDGSNTWMQHLGSTNIKDYFSDTYALNATKDHPGVIETAQNVYAEDEQSPIVLIPGVTPKFKITVSYVVRTYDDNLSTKYSEVTQTVKKTLAFQNPVEMNKHYNILMHLGLTGIKFTATVSNWEESAIGDSDGDSTPDNDVYLPINVQ